jgi:hypothetical protein
VWLCQNRCFGGKHRLHRQVTRIGELGTLAATSNRSTQRVETGLNTSAVALRVVRSDRKGAQS